jgi:hypothetical protein
MKKSCFGFADTPNRLLMVMDLMLKHGITIVGVTDAGQSRGQAQLGNPERFRVFGVAEDQSQIDEVSKEVKKAGETL